MQRSIIKLTSEDVVRAAFLRTVPLSWIPSRDPRYCQANRASAPYAAAVSRRVQRRAHDTVFTEPLRRQGTAKPTGTTRPRVRQRCT